MQITRKDIGYTIIARLEEALRSWMRERLLNLYGSRWRDQIPDGIWQRVLDVLDLVSRETVEDPLSVLEETEFTDLKDILLYRRGLADIIPDQRLKAVEVEDLFARLYDVRNKIAHVKRTFSAIDLDLLIEGANILIDVVKPFDSELRETLLCIKANPEKVVVRVPTAFFISEEKLPLSRLANLPPAEYDPDGGFIGRREDLVKVERLLLGDTHRVVTISGAGGVGKSALARRICTNLLLKDIAPFDAIIWVSAKEEKLTVAGIEPIDPSVRNFESVLDSILETFGWLDDMRLSLERKIASVEVILKAGDKGILLVVDNLETIRDEQIIEFIKDFPQPNKVLITSRMGLGEVERRYPLKEMTTKDAVVLLRTVAREKSVEGLATLPDSNLEVLVERMSRYPLAIKWVVGQVALGRDINVAMGNLTSSTGDVARFCFDHIFRNLLSEEPRKVLYALAANETPLSRGILSHVTNMPADSLDDAIRKLTIASLIIPIQLKSEYSGIETRYELLPLTRNYMFAQLQIDARTYAEIKSRMHQVENLLEEAEKAGKQYRYSLRDLGAETDEEKIAATWAVTGYQKFQANDYDGAVKAFTRGAQIAPNFAAIYRNWASVESDAGFYQKADELMRKAAALSPTDPRVWYVWGNIEKRRHRIDTACAYLQKALDLSPNDGFLMGAMGDLEKRRGNYELANGLLIKALENSPPEDSRKRHEIVCLTSLADNNRRWAETFVENQCWNEAGERLSVAYQYATKAADLGKDDFLAQFTVREVCLDRAFYHLQLRNFSEATQFFEKAFQGCSKRIKDRKLAERACFHLAEILLYEGKRPEAKSYFALGRKFVIEGGKYSERYKALSVEFSQERINGKVCRIVSGKGYGFIVTDQPIPQEAFLHISNIMADITIEEFEVLTGENVSFLLEKSDKGPAPVAIRVKVTRS